MTLSCWYFLNIAFICVLDNREPISYPKILSKTQDIGFATTNTKTIIIRTSQTVWAPTHSPYREHIDWGIIYPNITITTVEATKPTVPDVRSAKKIDRRELTATLPSKSVQSKRFPLFLTGIIFFANLACFSAAASS